MANYNLSLPAETIDELLLWLDDKQGIIIKQTDLLSGTGQSTTATMTQKAITDALGTKADASSVYTKTQTDNLLNAKADKSTTYTKTETDTLLGGKVDKEAGKGLSTNDYTDADKTKLGALPTAAELDSELAVLAGEAGLAEAVIDTDGAGTEQEFTFRKSGGDGGAYYRKIKGKTLAWNQLLPVPSTATAVINGVTFTNNGDGSVTANGTATGGSADFTLPSVAYIQGHKYLRFGAPAGGVVNGTNIYAIIATASAVAGADRGEGAILTAESSITAAIYIRVYEGQTVNNVKFWPQTVDLTLAGLASEISTPADFKALYPDAYYPYNPGTLISNDAEAVETTGVNQWDEEWEMGQLVDGSPSSSSTRFRSKNYCKCIGSASYYLCGSGYGTGVDISWYDSGQNYITRSASAWGAIVTAPAGAAYFKVCVWAGTIYNHDICINLSNAAINGQYFPYWKRTLQLGITTRKDTDGNVPFADGMKGDASVQDWCDKIGGEKRMGRVDLGSLEWFKISGAFYALYAQVKNSGSGDAIPANAICARYETASANSIYNGEVDKAIGIWSYQGGGVMARDNSYTNAAAFKAAMQGVSLDYELATPVPFTWAEPLNLGVKVDENGTERAVAPEGATAPSAPFVADTTYTMSVARMVEILKNL